MGASGSNRLTLATKVTLGRAFLIPVFAACLAYGREGIALAVFIVACVADGVDGHIARSRGEMTPLGAMLDPVADKLLMFIAYVMLGLSGHMPPWAAAIVVGRDALLGVGCAALFLTAGFQTPSPTLLGKATATVQMITAGAALLAAALEAGPNAVMLSLFLITSILTVASGAHYIFFVGARMTHPKPGGGQTGKPTPTART